MGEEQYNEEFQARKRRKVRKRKPIIGMLPRLALLGIVFLLIIVVCGAIIAKIAQPYAMAAVQGRQISVLSQELASTRLENSQLDTRRKSLGEPEGIEVAARDQGYLRQGEERLVLEPDPTPMPEIQSGYSFLNKWRGAWFSIAGH